MLDGVKVLDLTRMLSGPYAGMLLTDLGADVVKVEPPGGDPMRSLPPWSYAGMSSYFLSINRGKRSIVIDLESEAGRALLHDLAREADVVLYNYRPGISKRLGVDADTLHGINPRLIVCSLTGFGEDGPWASRPSYDLVIQALSGAMSLTGEPDRPPVRMGIPMGDLAGGGNCVTAIAAALYQREKTSKGTFLAVSLLDSLVGTLTYITQMYEATGIIPPPAGSGHQVVFPYMVVDTADQPIVLAIFVEKFWGLLCRAIGREEWATDPRFVKNEDRVAHRDVLEPALRARFREKTMQEWMELLVEHQVPTAPVHNIGQVWSNPQLQHQQMVVEIPDGQGGTVKTLGRPIKTPGVDEPPIGPAPELDAHAGEVLQQWLGLGDAERDARLASARDGDS